METMETATAKRTARVKTTLTKRTVEALEPAARPFIAWDDRLTGFGVRVQPSGAKNFVVNYRKGSGGRKAPNKRVTLGRFGRITADQARRMAQEKLGKVAGGGDPAEERAEARSMPTLASAEYAGTTVIVCTTELRSGIRRCTRLARGTSGTSG